MGTNICLGKKAKVELCLVPESLEIDDEQLEKEIKETLKCAWLAEVEKLTIYVHKPPKE